jgi:hemolysin activation/secretion protein
MAMLPWSAWIATAGVLLAVPAFAANETPGRAEFTFGFPAPQRSAIPRDIELVPLSISDIAIEGSTVFSRDDFAELTAPLIGHDGRITDILAVAEGIEAKYRAKGFLLARAVVPQQQPQNGVFRITIVEGYIREIVIDGIDGAARNRLAAVMAPIQSERPLRAATVERTLLLANDLPGLSVSGLVRPATDQPGAADLIITASESTVEFTAGIDNGQSRYAGPWQMTGDVAFNSVTGNGEQVTLGISTSPGWLKTRDFRLRYLQPVGTDGLFLTTYAQMGRDEAGYTMRDYGEMTRTVVLGQRAAYPLVRGRALNLVVDGGVAAKSTAVGLQGFDYYTDRWRVADVKGAWAQSGWLSTALSSLVSLDVSHGLNFAGGSQRGDANLSRSRGDPGFTKAVADAKVKWRIDESWAAYGAVSGQYAFSPLLQGEEFTVGGTAFGRGFDAAAILADHGIGETAELQYDLPGEPVITGMLQGFYFVDHGRVWDLTEMKTSPFLLSTGLGLRAQFDNGIAMTTQLAHPLHGPANTVHNDPIRPYFSVSTHF